MLILHDTVCRSHRSSYLHSLNENGERNNQKLSYFYFFILFEYLNRSFNTLLQSVIWPYVCFPNDQF